MFSSKSLTFRSVTHFELVFVGGVHVDIQLSLPRLLKDFFSPLNGLGILVENQLTINSQFYSRNLYVSPEYNTHCLDYYSFVISFEIKKCESSNLVLLFQDCSHYCNSLWILWSSCQLLQKKKKERKNTAGILIDIALNL